jgi:hypothetical protein
MLTSLKLFFYGFWLSVNFNECSTLLRFFSSSDLDRINSSLYLQV